MRHSKRLQSKTEQAGGENFTLAKVLAPEEIRAGDFVAVLHVVSEFSPLFWSDDFSTLPEPIRMRFVPEGGALPLKVKSVCLPYVLTKHPAGDPQTLDVRQHRLAKLDPHYGLAAWNAYKKLWKRRRASLNRPAITDC